MVADSSAARPEPRLTNRRSNKPIMEKRRRARINHCLNELKSLILNSREKDSCRHSKLEKADILEMTVGHVEKLQRADRFLAGWRQCLFQVASFGGLQPQVKKGLLDHLSSVMKIKTEEEVEDTPGLQISIQLPPPVNPAPSKCENHWRPW